MRKLGSIGFCLALAALVAASFDRPVYAGDCSVQGKVADGSDRPVARVWVVLSQGDTERARTLTGDDGRYYMAGLAQGSYRVRVRRGQTTLTERKVTLNGNETYNLTVS
jgi:hypothetical protein